LPVPTLNISKKTMIIDTNEITELMQSMSKDDCNKFMERLTELCEKETQMILSHLRKVEKLSSTPPETIASFKRTVSENLVLISNLQGILEKMKNAPKKSDTETTKIGKTIKPIGQKKQRKS